MVAYKAVGGGLQGSSYQGGLHRFGHAHLALIACDIGLYFQVFPTVFHLAVGHESIQFTPLFSTSSSNSRVKLT